jgi:hypothetical protein
MALHFANPGYLYYIRLKTEVGVLYKLGFTQSKTLERRFSDQSGQLDDDYQYIDQVYFFKFLKNAGSVESFIHFYLSEQQAFDLVVSLHGKRRVDYLPLPGNGQTELYYKDILKLDKSYNPTQMIVGKILLYRHIFAKERRLGIFLLFTWPIFLTKDLLVILVFLGTSFTKKRTDYRLKFKQIRKTLASFGIKPR